jgi:hypothetical protein
VVPAGKIPTADCRAAHEHHDDYEADANLQPESTAGHDAGD